MNDGGETTIAVNGTVLHDGVDGNDRPQGVKRGVERPNASGGRSP